MSLAADSQLLQTVEQEVEAELELVHAVVSAGDDLLRHAVEVRVLLGGHSPGQTVIRVTPE